MAQSGPDITSNLAGHWAFDEGSGTTATDSSGNGYTASLVGDTSWATGKVGPGSVSFDGSGDYINIPDPNLASGISSFTVSAWFKANTATSTSNRGLICIPAQGGIRSPFCTLIERSGIGGKISFNSASSSSAVVAKSNTALGSTDWVHIAVINDGSKLQLYVNNVLQTSQPAFVGTTTNPASPLRFNFSNIYGELGAFAGLLDDVRIYHSALSAQDISALYDLGSAPPAPPDTTPPSVSLTSPADGATVSDMVTVSAISVDNIAVAGVRFFLDFLDGITLSGEDTISPYEIVWNTASTSNGIHSLFAVSRDTSNNYATSTSISVTVDNVPPPQDTTPPSVSIASPANGSTILGTVAISADASDDTGVSFVRFAIDGSYLGAADSSAPYGTVWNTITMPNGTHSITAEARDAADNVATSASVTVTVDNSAADITSNLMFHLRFEERLGTTTVDSANGYVMKLLNGTRWVKGKFGSGAFFDGIDDYAELADPNIASGVPAFSVSLWFRANMATSIMNRGLVCVPSQGATRSPFCTGMERHSIGGKISFYAATTTAATFATSNAALNTTDWVHMVGTYDGANLKMYLNNVLQTSQPIMYGPTSNPPKPLRLNFSNVYGNTGTFGGVMDDVRIYHRALNAEEVNALHALPDTEVTFEEEPLAPWIEEPITGSTVAGTTTVITAQTEDGAPAARVQFYLDGAPLGAVDAYAPYSILWDTSLSSNGNHAISAVATSPSGVMSTTAPITVEVNNLPDITPPLPPSTVRLIPVGANQINVAWTEGIDNVLILNYDVYRCQGTSCTPTTFLGTTVARAYRDVGLATSTPYSYHIVARDSSGNVSSPSSVEIGSTLASTALCGESDNRFSFGVFSDSYGGHEGGLRRALGEMLSFDPNIRMFLTGGDTPSYQRVRGIVNESNGKGLCTGSQFAFYPTVGNHDAEVPSYMDWWATSWTGDWENNPQSSPLALHLPGVTNFKRGPLRVRTATGFADIQDGTIYSFDYKNAHFIAVNTYEQGISDSLAGVWDLNGPTVFDPTESQLDWIAADLASTTKPFKFAFAHNALITPVYSLSSSSPPGWSEHNRSFHMSEVVDLFADNNLTAYFFGHDHVASRTLMDGTRTDLYKRLYWDNAEDTFKPFGNPSEWETLQGPGKVWQVDVGRVYSTASFYTVVRINDTEAVFETYNMPNSTPGTSYLWDTFTVPIVE